MKVGQEIYVEKLEVEIDSVVTFDQVLLVGGESTVVGNPLINGASVTAKVLKQGRAKIIVFKYKPKKTTDANKVTDKAIRSYLLNQSTHNKTYD